MLLPTAARNVATDALLALVHQVNEHNVAGETHADRGSHANEAVASSYCNSDACLRNWKIVFAVILFLEGLIFGYFTLLLRRFACITTRKFRKLLHFVNAGGGGVFLATGLLHILPEAADLLEPKEPGAANEAHAHEGSFPTAYAVVLATFFVFLFFDRVLFASSHSIEHASNKFALRHSTDLEDEDDDDEDGSAVARNDTTSTVYGGASNGFGSPAFVAALFCVLGLSAHSLFESVALGGSSSFTTTLHAFIAIAAHRWATSMALGSIFGKHELTAGAYSVLNVLFALVAPIGIGIGFAIQSTSEVFQGIVFSLSAGTFLYIGAFETVSHEFVEHRKNLVVKYCVMAAGASIMVIITGALVAADVH